MDEELEETSEKLERDEHGRLLPGQKSLNPEGRPEGSFSLKTILKQEIQKQPRGQQLTFALALIRKQLQQAINDGDTNTQKLIWNYLEGLPLQTNKTDITSGGKPLLTLEQINELLLRRTGTDNASG